MSSNAQQNVWEQEHTSQKAFATMHTLKPSNYIPHFYSFLEEHGIPASPERVILDIGCGKGRNSIYMAQQGYRVHATDFSEKALSDARVRSAQANLKIEFEQADLADDWPFSSEFADAILDANTSVFVPEEGRIKLIQEAHRVLKTGGFYFFYGLAELPDQPRPDYDTKGFAEKRYTLEELTNAYHDFAAIQAQIVMVKDMMDGQEIENTMWYAIFQKQ